MIEFTLSTDNVERNDIINIKECSLPTVLSGVKEMSVELINTNIHLSHKTS